MTATEVYFCDLPDDSRWRYRNAIDQHGGEVESYSGVDVQVRLPTDWREFITAMEINGLSLVPGSRYYFPLGSDVMYAPRNLRHDGSYPGSRGFWMLARFRPVK